MARRVQGRNEEHSILQGSGLAAGFHLLVESSSTFSAVERHSTSLPLIYSFCEELSRSPEIMRALTDLHHYSFSDFQRALFCSWFSVCFARFLSLDNQRVHDLFCAGLLQDIGKCLPKLDLSEWVSDFKPEEERYLSFHGVDDSHPLIASSFIEQHFEEHRDIKDLVLHHHARADGLGYPEGIVESFLSLDDQILIVANGIQDKLQLVEERSTIEQGLAQLRVASYFYFKNTHSECIRFLNSCISYQPVIARLEKQVGFKGDKAEMLSVDTKSIDKKWQNLSHCVLVASELNRALACYTDDPLVRGLRQFIEKLMFLAFDQGVIDQALTGQEASTPTSQQIDKSLLFASVQHHLNDYERYLDYLIESNQFERELTLITKAIASLSLCISSPKLK